MMFDSFQAVKRVQLRRSWRTRRHGWTGVGKGPCCTSRGSWENGGRHRRGSVAMLWVRTVYSCNNQSIDDNTLMLWLRLRLVGFDTKDTTKTTTRGTVIVLAFEFCRFCLVIRFFHPRHNGQWPPTLKDFSIPDFIHYICFPILIL